MTALAVRDASSLTGSQKAAVVLVQLGREQAAKVLSRMGPVEVEELATEIAQLGALDAEDGWDADAWADALEPYFEAYDEIGTGPAARGPALLMIEQGRDRWTVRQIFDDPAGDHDWGITAEVDLAASDEEGRAVIRVTAFDRLD